MKHDVNNAASSPLAEHEIRAALRQHLITAIADGQRIEEEFRIERGAARVDIAVIGNGLSGFEIKSDFDTLKRLSNQIHAYNRVFDQITIVCGEKLVGVAQQIMPSWWGVIGASRQDDNVVALHQHRPAATNPLQEPLSLASLLWREELVSILTANNMQVSTKSAAHALWQSLTETLPVDQMKVAINHSLLMRDQRKLRVKTM